MPFATVGKRRPVKVAELHHGRFAERVIVAGSACALVAAIAAIDERVRGHITSVLTGGPSADIAMAGARVQRLARLVTETVGYQGSENASLVFLVLAAVALLVLMLRT